MKAIAFLLLCIVPPAGLAYEQDASIFYGRLKGTQNDDVTYTWGANLSYGINDWFAVNAVWLNEGHPENHHRDGFAIQPSLYKDFNNWRVQLSTGPYYSMDTTRQADGTVLNAKNLGLLSSLALKWHPGTANWYLGIGYNHVWMRNKLNTDSVVLFLGMDSQREHGNRSGIASKTKPGLWIGHAKTTLPSTDTKTGVQLEVAFPVKEHFSYSIAGLYEGNTTLADRKGVMAQAWYNETFNNWTLSAGAGPYLAHDSLRDETATKLLAIVSLRATYKLMRRTDVGVNVNRVISFYHRDADMVLLGVQTAF